VQLLGAGVGVLAEVTEVDREPQLGVPADQRQRLVQPVSWTAENGSASGSALSSSLSSSMAAETRRRS